MPKRGGSANVTTDHQEIRRWVEERGGCPATVKRTGRSGGAGLLRIDYPGFSGRESLQAISWDEFFAKFDEQNLAFLYQNETASGDQSRFSKLVSREKAGPAGESNGRDSGRNGRNGRTEGRSKRSAAAAQTSASTGRSRRARQSSTNGVSTNRVSTNGARRKSSASTKPGRAGSGKRAATGRRAGTSTTGRRQRAAASGRSSTRKQSAGSRAS